VDERRRIFEVHLRRRGRDATTFDLAGLSEASEGFSGAEIEEAVVGGLYAAFAAQAELDTGRVLAELRATKPLSRLRAREVESLRAWARDRTVSSSEVAA
jgi:SpoVK/Ycf46/Vps4 family AAA+-type ATPase